MRRIVGGQMKRWQSGVLQFMLIMAATAVVLFIFGLAFMFVPGAKEFFAVN